MYAKVCLAFSAAIPALVLFAWPHISFAEEFTSTNFIIKDPVIEYGGGESTSAGFVVNQSIGPAAGGRSSSAGFNLCSGFQCYPAVVVEEEEEVPAPPPPPGDGVLITFLRAFLPPIPELPLIPEILVPCLPITDLNCDGKINLQDLSIFLFFEPKSAPNPADFNRDTRVDIRDLSILFSDWTERLLSLGLGEGEPYEIFREREKVSLFSEPEKQLTAVAQLVTFKERKAQKIEPRRVYRIFEKREEGLSLFKRPDVQQASAAQVPEISQLGLVQRIGQLLGNIIKGIIDAFRSF
ncbi:hypothetical protein IIA95_03670 [Patescibacteria group bacterium]|nr:hypothetical protein [Patescibacteria group bacterium]